MAVVIDASGMIVSLVGTSPAATNLRRRLGIEICHAPHLIDAEVGNVLRRLVLRGDLSTDDAESLLHAGQALVDYRHEMTGAVASQAWHLLHNVTFYDSLYVAVAAGLALPLLTADARLASAPRLGCVVELVESA